MSLYLDSSLLVSLIALEPASGDVDVWLQSRIGEDLVSSGWVFAEVSSALSIKLRTKELTLEERGAAMTRFRALSAQALIHLPVFERHFATAARYCDAHDLGLRASDALHLAVAADNGAAVCTRDVRMASAASSLGIATTLVRGGESITGADLIRRSRLHGLASPLYGRLTDRCSGTPP